MLGTPSEASENPREHTAQRALEGFTRSAGKEVREGGSAQLVYVAPGAEDQIESTLRFLLSPRSRVRVRPGRADRDPARTSATSTGSSR